MTSSIALLSTPPPSPPMAVGRPPSAPAAEMVPQEPSATKSAHGFYVTPAVKIDPSAGLVQILRDPVTGAVTGQTPTVEAIRRYEQGLTAKPGGPLTLRRDAKPEEAKAKADA